ncbi:MAG: TonB-dependent receptor [Acidobacteriaceae bacterium]|nr:TonB-dependent receptor [Acidobacteriaceae bacterium]
MSKNRASAVTQSGVAETAQQYFGNACGTPAASNIPCNLPVLAEGSSLLSPFYNGLQYSFRGDQYFGQKDRIYGSYGNDTFNLQHLNVRPNFTNEDFQNNWYAQTDWTHTFSSTLLFEFGFGANAVGGENGQNGNNSIPQINVTGQSIGFTNSWGPGEYRSHSYNWRDVLNWVHGAHTFKFGSNGSHQDEEGDFTPVNNRPTFTFNNLLDLVQDQPYSETGVAYNPLTGNVGTVNFGGQLTAYGVFAQDDWKARSNLSFTFSLRWDNLGNHYPWGNNFQFSNLILGSGSTFAQQVANASVRPVKDVFAQSLNNNWSPRIGFAWDPSHNGIWSIRGGVGVYHDWIALGQTVDQMRNNPPGVVTPSFVSGVTAIQPLFAIAPNATYPFNYPLPSIPAGQLNSQGGLVGLQAAVTALDRKIKAPYAVNYVIGVEHQLPWKLVAGANYSGSRGYDQLSGTDVNRFNGSLIANNGTLVRLNPSFGSIDYVSNKNASTYNAMILALRRTVGARATFQASYTLSHAMDYPEAGTRFDQDNGLNIPDPTAYSTYWGDANWDVRHRFSFSGMYTLPGPKSGWIKPFASGWQISTIAAIQTGTPFWVYTTAPFGAGGDYNADGLNWDVPNAPNTNYTGSHGEHAYLNGLFSASAFPAPAPGTEGNLKRNIYTNPGMLNLDASLLKNTHIPLGEAGNLQLKFDFINVLNRVNLGPVDANMADSTFGKSITTLNPRSIQLGARISF